MIMGEHPSITLSDLELTVTNSLAIEDKQAATDEIRGIIQQHNLIRSTLDYMRRANLVEFVVNTGHRLTNTKRPCRLQIRIARSDSMFQVIIRGYGKVINGASEKEFLTSPLYTGTGMLPEQFYN